SAPLESPLPIPAGFRVRSKDAKVIFTTGSAVVLGVGATSISLTGTCTTAGLTGNNYAPGQISQPLDTLGVTFTVTNSETTDGGAPSEDTEALRRRFPLAIRALSVAGPSSSYESLARGASAEVRDVFAMSPEPLLMRIYVLAVDGEASPELLETVVDRLDPVDARPALDEVEAVSAVSVEWTIEVELVLRKGRTSTEDTAADLAMAIEHAEAYANELRQKIKATPVRNELIARVKHANVYDLTVVEPATNVALDDGEWADCTAIAITVVGYEGDP
ncbi:MAG TPA: baseplate J/gp47 family protein, partial [Polyangiaceae bacterium]|nr:baseplate J/gp47 family protein [Polyangiaceae bacterium]